MVASVTMSVDSIVCIIVCDIVLIVVVEEQ